MSLAEPVNRWEYQNRNAIKEHPRNDFLGITVETKDAVYNGIPWSKLDSRERRKWENMLVLAFADTKIRISYH